MQKTTLRITYSDSHSDAPNPSGRLWAKEALQTLYSSGCRYAEELWHSRWYYPVLLLSASLFLFTGWSLAGMLVMVLFLEFFRVFCSDLKAGLLPIFLFFLMGTDYFHELNVLTPWWWLIPVHVVCSVLHFRLRKKKVRICGNYKSLIAVSIALLCSGWGFISFEEYLSITTLYYAFGLGFMMLGFAFLYAGDIQYGNSRRNTDIYASILYCTGIFASFVVLNYYLHYQQTVEFGISTFGEYPMDSGILFMRPRNYLTTILITTMPMAFRFARKNRWHYTAAVMIYVCSMLTGSRSGVLFGTLVFTACLYLNLMQNLTQRRAKLFLGITSGLFAVALIFLISNTAFQSRLVDGQLIPVTDTRVAWLKRSIEDFLSNPLTGIGISNMKNSNIYLGVTGSIAWYHNYFEQIIGSMGILGIIAYSWLLRDRFTLTVKMFRYGEPMLAMTYLGMFLVSMVQPGEFCPLPNEFMIIILFDLMYGVAEQKERMNFKTLSSTSVLYTGNFGVRTSENASATENLLR